MNEKHNCHGLINSISDYVDGELAPELCAELERHLSECTNCRIVVDTLRKTIELYKDTTEAEPIPDEVRQRLFYRLHLEDFLQS
jgi:anti-sigma factor (TIGR02949 family)